MCCLEKGLDTLRILAEQRAGAFARLLERCVRQVVRARERLPRVLDNVFVVVAGDAGEEDECGERDGRPQDKGD